MNCLCCGKPIRSQASASNDWHKTCIRRFFGTSVMPEINILNETLELLAAETTNKGLRYQAYRRSCRYTYPWKKRHG